jgi:hypothetical protein
MTETAYFDDIITVTASIDHQGQIMPQGFIWQGKQQTITSAGRQWETDQGRHILVEAANGDRFELLLSRDDLLWRLKRAWQAEFLA